MDIKLFRNAVAGLMIVVMVATAFFVPTLADSDEVYASDKEVFYNVMPTTTIPGKIVANKAFSVIVRGDDTSTTAGAVEGDIAFVPTRIQIKKGAVSYFSRNLSGAKSQTLSNIKLSRVGNFTVTITYQQKKLTSGAWVNDRTRTDTKTIDVWGTVKFKANKGKFAKGSIKSKVVQNGKKYGKMAKLKKRKGYKFMGWYTAKTGGSKVTKKSTVNLTADTALYAQWKYTIKFNANKGKVSKKSKKVTSGKAYGKLPTPKRSGYDFLGWYTKKKGGTEVNSLTYVAKAKKHTVYAQWAKKGKDKYPGLITKTKYKKIKVGMTYDEVVAIVGGGFDFCVTPTIGGVIWQRTSRWNVANKGTSVSEQVIIVFTAGWVVKSKSNPYGW